MFSIRRNVFETNSSSTHSICICTQDEYGRWYLKDADGEYAMYIFDGSFYAFNNIPNNLKEKKFLTKDEVIEFLKEYRYFKDDFELDVQKLNEMNNPEFNEFLNEYGLTEYFKTPNEYYNDYLEDYSVKFTTPSGDKMIAFGQYGNDY